MVRYLIFNSVGAVLLAWGYSIEAYRGYFFYMFFVVAGFMILLCLGEFFRPEGQKNNQHVLFSGSIAILIIFLFGHYWAYQDTIIDIAEYERSQNDSTISSVSNDLDLFNNFMKRLTQDPDASGFTAYIDYLKIKGFEEEVRVNEYYRSEGNWVLLALVQQLAMLGFGLWVVWKAVDPDFDKKYLKKKSKSVKSKTGSREPQKEQVQRKKISKDNPSFSDDSINRYDHYGTEALNELLTKESLIKYFGNTARHAAKEFFKSGLAGSVKDDQGMPILFGLIMDRREVDHIIKITLKNTDWKVKDSSGNTILHYLGNTRGRAPEYFRWNERPYSYSESEAFKLDKLAIHLIKEGVASDIPNKKGVTATMLIARNCSKYVLREVLKGQVDIHQKDGEGSTALMYAVKGGDSQLDQVEMLIQAGSNVLEQDNQGKTALHIAARNANKIILRRLTDQLNPKEKAPVFTQLLHGAIDSRDVDLIKTLLKEGADPDHAEQLSGSAMKRAMSTRDTLILEALIDAGASIDADEDSAGTLLNSAVAFLWPEGIEFLLERDVMFKAFPKGFTPYMQLARKAVNGGHMHLWEGVLEKLRLLNISAISSDSYDNTALDYLTGAWNLTDIKENEHHIILAELLLELGADPDRVSKDDGLSPSERAKNKGLDGLVQIFEAQK